MDRITHSEGNHKGTRNCERCGAIYEPKVNWQKYCNNDGKCRIAAFRKRHPQMPSQLIDDIKKIKEKLGIK